MPPGHGPGRRPRPHHGGDLHRGHRRGQPGCPLDPGSPRTRLRGAHRLSSATTSPPSTTPPIPTSTGSHGTTRAWRTCRTRPHRSSPRGTQTRPPDRRRRSLGARARGGVRRRRPGRPRPSGLGRRGGRAAPASSTPSSSCTARPGRTSTPPRTIPTARPRRTSTGTANAAAIGAPIVAFSSDYVFDGTKRGAYLESDRPAPLSVYGATKLAGEAAAGERAWVVRTSWLFGPTGHNFLRTMLRLGADRDEVRGCRGPARVPYLRRPSRRSDAGARRPRRPLRRLAPRCAG